MVYDAILDADELLPERPFTDPAGTVAEAEVMQRMLAHERERARAWMGEEAGEATVRFVRELDDEFHRHLLVVPDAERLLRARDFTAVGFFGRTRAEVDHGILFELEDELVSRMSAYGGLGLLSYYDVEFPKGAYGNLILFATPEVPAEWHADAVHRRAVELSAKHYHEVRLHKGSVRGDFLDEAGKIDVERTRYFAFQGEGRWQALRRYQLPGLRGSA